MTAQELKKLVQQGEHHTLEFKKKVAHPEKIVREVVAFANSQGGTLLVGVADNGELSGIPYPEEERWVLDRAIRELCRPSVEFTTHSIAVDRRSWVICYQIGEGQRKPYYVLEKEGINGMPAPKKGETKGQNPYRKKVYIRKGDRSIQASREMREILRRRNAVRNTTISWGPAEQILLRYLQENITVTVRQFAREARLRRSVAAGILVRMVLSGIVRIIPSEGEDTYVAAHLT